MTTITREMLLENLDSTIMGAKCADDRVTFIMTSSVSPDGDNALLKLLDFKFPDGTNVVKNPNFIQSCNSCIRLDRQDQCIHIVRPIFTQNDILDSVELRCCTRKF